MGAGAGEPWFYFRHHERWMHRMDRSTPSGYWKTAGKASFVYSADRHPVGLKKSMLFYRGPEPSGRKTKWKIDEFWALDNAANGSEELLAQLCRSRQNVGLMYKIELIAPCPNHQ
uniref:NAC-domain containing protein 90-like n=1 Tax=Oryza rufipogon TaxID=4529 RepID=A0A679BBJ6_ORYRU|nr:NAC-domain containing protein 90-like [Oryza rufipogon]BBF90105.1 NAC-domain containing protein 90-like [Oryza rufipogon]